MTDQRATLEREAKAIFEDLKAEPEKDDVHLQRLLEWVGRSDAHQEVYASLAVEWVSTLVTLEEARLDAADGDAATRH